MADDVSATGKYLLISVPEFAKDPVGGRANEPMTSFLRLGAFHEQPSNEAAQARSLELAKLAEQVSTVQGGPLSPYTAEVIDGSGVSPETPFLDDLRSRGGDTAGGSAPDRLTQSAALFTRGGWWDHSDGNRISTTYGDKVEVIRGNYKMIMMGRQDEPGYAASFDASGGVIQDLGNSMIGASVRADYRPDRFGGVWHLENATIGFIQTDDFYGDKFSHDWGEFRYSTTGCEAGSITKGEKTFPNPEIIEKTWATRIESYTGSTGRRIPEIKDETYAEKTSSLTDVSGNVDETTYCDGTMTSTTGSAARPVPVTNETTYAGATTSRSHVGASNEFTTVGVAMSTTMAGTLGSLKIAALQGDVEVIGAKGSVSACGAIGEIALYFRKRTLTVGNSFEWKFGTHDDNGTEKKKLALKKLETALDNLHTSLIDKRVSMDMKFTSLAVHLQGMQVAIGM